jgi:hypothetical protein
MKRTIRWTRNNNAIQQIDCHENFSPLARGSYSPRSDTDSRLFLRRERVVIRFARAWIVGACFIILPTDQGNVAAGTLVEVQVMEGVV